MEEWSKKRRASWRNWRVKEGRDKRRRGESEGESGGGGGRRRGSAMHGGGKEAVSLGGSQAALSVSVAAQSGLPSPWPREPAHLPCTTSPAPPPAPTTQHSSPPPVLTHSHFHFSLLLL
ncbi:unnamed protein product [Pleuronectes platessa]|uniref:Uncharacterized protein n=1 Tax=Pleuronectes platessa TaxID=8262 RepID=A0A9N7VPN1_PLEPL|nr:unnamed protein product [Pleuronectes platessa]